MSHVDIGSVVVHTRLKNFIDDSDGAARRLTNGIIHPQREDATRYYSRHNHAGSMNRCQPALWVMSAKSEAGLSNHNAMLELTALVVGTKNEMWMAHIQRQIVLMRG